MTQENRSSNNAAAGNQATSPQVSGKISGRFGKGPINLDRAKLLQTKLEPTPEENIWKLSF